MLELETPVKLEAFCPQLCPGTVVGLIPQNVTEIYLYYNHHIQHILYFIIHLQH